METMLSIGLAVSLGGPLVFMLAAKKFGFTSLSIPGRLFLWLLAFVALLFAPYGAGPSWLTHIGVEPFGWLDLLSAVVVVVVSLVGAILLQLLQHRLGIKNPEGAKLSQKIFALSTPKRFFIVVTASVVEEILYRGYAIGIGQYVWGGLAAAFVVSLFVFVVAHFSHGLFQLITVCWIALFMSLLFVYTNNLFACMLAHFVVDAVGILVMPWIVSRKRAQMVSSTQEG